MKKTFERSDFYIKKSPPKRSLLSQGLIIFLFFFIGILNSPMLNASNSVSDQQERKISGKITDQNGAPVIGATVIVTGTSVGTLTDIDGNFTLQAPGNAQSLSISFVGFNSQVVTIGSQIVYNVTLQEAAIGLQEVVVIGYGTSKRADLTGAVSSLPSSQIKDASAARAEQALVGKIAGVEVRTTTGEPGAPPQIRIRGISSISATADPLYIVDGFPVISIQSLNPSDIEAIDILKDASATAIYGSRGSNGVVLITTKRGKTGSAVITLDTYYGLQKITMMPKMQSAMEEAQNYFDGVRNKNLDNGKDVSGDPLKWATPAPITLVQLLNGQTPTSPGTTLNFKDHLGELLQVAPEQSIVLSASGGTENTKYSISGEYMNQDGLLLNTNFNRYSLRANIDAKLTKKLNLKINFSPSFTTKLNAGNTTIDGVTSVSATANAVYNAMLIPEYYALKNDDGTYFPYGSGLDAVVQAENPLALVKEVNNKQKVLFLLGNINLEYAIFDELKFNIMAGANLATQKGMSFLPLAPYFESKPATGTDNASLTYNWLTEYTLNYNKVFGKHFITGLAGFTVQKQQGFSNTITSNKYPNNLVPTLSATSGIITNGSSNESAWSLISYLARINYNYAGKYYLTGSIRTDGSSRFGKNNKWGLFPSGAVAWRISDEGFFKDNVHFITELKLRGSWGNTGNNNIGNYQSIATVTYLKYALNNAAVGAYAPGRPENDDLTWERQLQTNVGFDLGLFNRINISTDFFNTINKDLLLNVNVSQVTGYATALLNIGQVNNKGWEFTISSTNLKGKFEWTTDFNISAYKNKVVKLGPEGDPIISGGHITQIGSPIGMFYGWIKDGIFMNQAELDAGPIWNPGAADRSRVGDIRFKDISGPNGVPDGKIDNFDKTIMGSPYPDFYYGMTNHFSFKNITLSVSLQGSKGNEILQLSRTQLLNDRSRFRQLAVLNNYWKSEAEPGDGQTPRPNDTPTGNWRGEFSTQWLDNGTYLRINNISLSYILPESITSKLKMKSLRVYVNSTNPFTFTKYLLFNPDVSRNSSSLQPGEENFDYPIAKSIIFGMTLTL
jgi:TonB-linked SusC/RagA family outer membrane protein